MKKHISIWLCMAGFGLVACQQENNPNKLPVDIINIQATADSTNLKNGTHPQISFTETEHQFGKITEGEVVEYSFKFKNSGDGDLLIVTAKASCGCTVPDYPKGIIKPGEEGFLKVKFDSKGKQGTFDKTVTVTCNTEPRETVLTISGEVVEGK